MKKIDFSQDDWRKRLTPEQFRILRKNGTERAFTSPLHANKRKGVYKCAGCGTPLFTSDQKYDSGTGWPSFFETLPGVFDTKKDYKLIRPRIEYHCAVCGGHHGHVFVDGPPPTAKRYCNNGEALIFEEAENETQDG
jgi:peptide-methionine (R)-S-oxide reductase